MFRNSIGPSVWRAIWNAALALAITRDLWRASHHFGGWRDAVIFALTGCILTCKYRAWRGR